MRAADLSKVLAQALPVEIADDLVGDFLKIRQDVLSGTLERSSPGKFVESFVQALQFLETGKYHSKPSVDSYLNNVESRASALGDGLRIIAARVARAMYTLRNKRNIAHKGEIDPNLFDLRFLHSAAQWILTELVRMAAGGSPDDAARLVDEVQAPAGGIIEDFEGRRVVLVDVNVEEEIIVLLHSYYPDRVRVKDITQSLERRNPSTVRGKIRDLWASKLVDGGKSEGYKLTLEGLKRAIVIINKLAE